MSIYSLQSFRGLLYFEGIIFIILGLIGIAVPQLLTIGIELLIGSLFLVGGFFQLYRAFKIKGSSGFKSTLLNSILSIALGLMLLFFPLAGIFSLTYLLIAYFLVDGATKAYFATQVKENQNWGWVLFSGLLSLGLGILILTGLPGSAAWVLGLLVGINMLFFGISLFFLASQIKKTS